MADTSDLKMTEMNDQMTEMNDQMADTSDQTLAKIAEHYGLSDHFKALLSRLKEVDKEHFLILYKIKISKSSFIYELEQFNC